MKVLGSALTLSPSDEQCCAFVDFHVVKWIQKVFGTQAPLSVSFALPGLRPISVRCPEPRVVR